MRPLKLEMSGFRSHEKKSEISFEGRNFIAIVGPTGSGKSSILDAISFALYARTPRLKTKTKRLICSRTEAAHVKLLFAVEGKKYEISRVLRNQGSSEHLMVDLSTGEKITGETAITEHVEELLGLDFEAFCSSVLLAQGRFSEFLDAAATKKMQILKGVFRMDQIDELRKAAKGKVDDLELEIRGVAGEQSGIPEDITDLIKTETAGLKTLDARAVALTEALPREKQLIKEAEGAEAEKAAAEKALAAAESSLGSLPAAEVLTTLADEEDALAELVTTAEKAFMDASAAADEASKKLALLEGEMGSVGALSELKAKAEAHASGSDDLVVLEKSLEASASESSLLKKTAASLASAAESAAADRDKATAAVREIERAHQAHALRVHLVAGEPCPVCEQTIATIPSTKAPSAVAAAEKAEKSAIAASDAAAKSAADAEKAVVSAEAGAVQLEKQVTTQRKTLFAASAALIKGLGDVKDFVAETTKRLAALSDAATGAGAATKTVKETRTLRDETAAKHVTIEKRRHDLCATVILVAGRLENVISPQPSDSARTLCERADAIRSAVVSQVEEAHLKVEKAEGAAGSVGARLAELRKEQDVDAEVSLADELSDVKADTAAAKQRIADWEKAQERAKALIAKRKEIEGRQDIYQTLAKDLTDQYFIKFLLEDRRKLLSQLGSAYLIELTERYRFDDDAEFNVIDELDGDKKREILTLSGGELFLASLALSLGLAEAVARHGGRLQCFFLDEGFGSLDPEALGHALDGIEKIVSPERLIGLVSHVAELSARVEDKIELERTPEGMTLIAAGAMGA